MAREVVSLNFTERKAKNTNIWKDELKKNKEKKEGVRMEGHGTPESYGRKL